MPTLPIQKSKDEKLHSMTVPNGFLKSIFKVEFQVVRIQKRENKQSKIIYKYNYAAFVSNTVRHKSTDGFRIYTRKNQ